MKLTGWYGYEQKPTRVGVYETMLVHSGLYFADRNGFSLWDGYKWRDTNSSINDAYLEIMDGVSKKMWRGVAK